MACRFVCCGCYYRTLHNVLSFELVECEEEYVRIEVKNPTATENCFFCAKFNAIPNGLTSYPIRVTLNEEDVPVEDRDGNIVTTARLYECMVLSGMYILRDREPVLVVC